MAIRCNTPRIRIPRLGSLGSTHCLKTSSAPSHLIKGHQLIKRPIAKIKTVRLSTFFQKTAGPASCKRGITKDIAFPTANRKNGKTRSVGEHPCQVACLSGANMCAHVPGLFTIIISATVAPRNTSKE
ncbi:hypothetical protein D3C81_1067170 [compost metagenome]